ncbi:flavin reductase [Plantactinospora sp. BC1]|uniref:flavin reductase n=1 Tax=Plantactinospora sp. BC1 TaxID=2108470 RepID=UPI000D155CD4|nr:flavin reductase [Plantactinospora sp. BC1]AVT32814.1 flavin reductase [Plantactinospora sp. BC1]
MIGPQERWYRHMRRLSRRRYPIGPHTPARSYHCQTCQDPWPCAPARLALLIGFNGDRVGLMMYLGAHLTRALQAMPDTHPALIAGQILYWVPRRR